jgi:hypothetical protein
VAHEKIVEEILASLSRHFGLAEPVAQEERAP